MFDPFAAALSLEFNDEKDRIQDCAVTEIDDDSDEIDDDDDELGDDLLDGAAMEDAEPLAAQRGRAARDRQFRDQRGQQEDRANLAGWLQEDLEVRTGLTAASSASASATSSVAQQGSKRKRLPAKAAPPKRKSRKMNPNHRLRTIPIEEKNGSNIRCIFVPRSKGQQEAVPLWPQYKVQWKDADFKDDTWLVLSNYERWVMLIVNAITNKSVRQVAQDIFCTAACEFKACLTQARGGSTDADSDDESVEATSLKNVNRQASISIKVGGFSLICINYKKQILIRVDDESVVFIRHWFLPLATQAALSQAAKPLPVKQVASKTAAAPDVPKGFSFRANPTPTILGKVLWSPVAHAFKVRLLKPRKKCKEEFPINPRLDGAAYAKAKAEAYRRAVDAWNECDGSKRYRIKVSQALLDDRVPTPGPQQTPASQPTPGSQPSSGQH